MHSPHKRRSKLRTTMSNSNDGSKPCSAGAVVLMLSKGKRRVSLWDLATATWNRGGVHTSGLNAQKKITKITLNDGFAEYRYVAGWCHEPNPKDPLEVWRHHEEMRSYDSLLVKLEQKHLKGVFKCAHLVAGLQMFACGERNYAEPFADMPMSLSDANGQMLETIKEGAFMEVFSFEDVQKNKPAFDALCDSDNFDHAMGLASDEVQCLVGIYEKVALTRSGDLLYDKAVEVLAARSGGRFSAKDIGKLWGWVASTPKQVAVLLIQFIAHAQSVGPCILDF